jgi:hypothetical protein
MPRDSVARMFRSTLLYHGSWIERGDNVDGGVLRDGALYGEEVNIKKAQGKRIQRNIENL